jgi:hypothetical protein
MHQLISSILELAQLKATLSEQIELLSYSYSDYTVLISSQLNILSTFFSFNCNECIKKF